MRILIYIALFFISFGCSQQANEASYAPEEESKTEAVGEMTEIEINEMTPLEYIILGKLQEIYDLKKIIADSTVSKEIRLEAQNALANLIADTEIIENIKNGTITNVKLTTDSNHITFELDNQLKEAEIKVEKEVVVIEGEKIDNIEITVEGIK